MGKVAFLFPGQGAQFAGMGEAIQKISGPAADVFAAADSLRPDTSRQCFSGTEEELRAAADSALADQALPRRYAHGLAGDGAVMWSVAFDAHKHAAVARA